MDAGGAHWRDKNLKFETSSKYSEEFIQRTFAHQTSKGRVAGGIEPDGPGTTKKQKLAPKIIQQCGGQCCPSGSEV